MWSSSSTRERTACSGGRLRAPQDKEGRRLSLLLWPILFGGNKPEISLAAAGVIDLRTPHTIQQGDLVVGQLETDGPLCADGYIKIVCEGRSCFVVR